MQNASSGGEPSLHDVLSLFKDRSGDETGGQHAVRGFSFQVWQAVLETLKAHATGEDYAVVLEWQQDIAVLDSSKQPTRVTFIQLKKNESTHHWTLNGLLAPPPAPAAKLVQATFDETGAPTAPKRRMAIRSRKLGQSPLAKLYFHRQRFSALTRPPELVFASNAPFYVGVGDDDQNETVTAVELCDLPAASVAKVQEAFRKQLEVPENEAIALDGFRLTVTNCPTEEAHKFAIGELVELCQLKKIEPQVNAPFIAICLVASYVQQRAGKRAYAKDLAGLLERAVTRTEVTQYFAAANDTEVADYEMVQEMEAAVNTACAEVTNRASVVWLTAQALVDLYVKNNQYKANGNLKARLPAWLADLRAMKVRDSHLYSDGFLYCLMAMTLKDAQPLRHLSTAATGSQPEAAS
ncbi:MAG: hypothetical protein CFE41_08565 [Burkholderiales bacterium PBB2]|nr:MAG: hypothetical protein CFE41_08565 [Burkholderiales bacterium PBB2]